MGKQLAEAVLKAAAVACRDTIGAKLTMMFALGRAVHEIERLGRKNRPSDDEGMCRRDTIKRVRDHVTKDGEQHGYDVPQSEAYWFAAVDAVTYFTAAERAVLVAHNVPWSEIPSLLAKREAGKQMIADLGAGKIASIRLRKRDRPRVHIGRTGKVVASGADALEVVTVHVTGDDDILQQEMECLLTRLGKARYERLVTAAMQRLRW